ncbi:MAG TPA: aminotransferase class IV [Kofleriaceae bacterium]|nr:aminotransferase class IV [Kofleriaceae bacterium]
MIISIDGRIIAPEAATISVLDRGLLYGDGLFEVLRTWRGVAVTLDDHLARLHASAEALALRVPGELPTWVRAAISAAVAAGGSTTPGATGDHRVRVIVTRGPGPLGARLADLGPGRAIAIVEPLPAQPAELAVATVEWPVPRRARGHKTLAYLDHVVARELAAAAGADEAIRLDDAGHVVEAATATLFVVTAGAVTTPPLTAGILPGITRARVLALCAAEGIAARERRLALAELRAADEIFATSALRGVVPITRLDGEPRASGPVTFRVADAYTRAMTAAL